MKTTDVQQFVEVFPIRREAIPPLVAYTLSLHDRPGAGGLRTLGARLAAYLSRYPGGIWVWYGDRLISDGLHLPDVLATAVADVIAAEPKVFRTLAAIVVSPDWIPDAAAEAEVVVRGILPTIDPQIIDALRSTLFSIKNTRITREYRVRTWTVSDAPALSITVISRLLYEPDLQAYIETLEATTDLLGLRVADKNGRLSGEIIKLVGRVDEHRDRLLGLTRTAAGRQQIESAAGDHLVIRLLAGFREFDYVSDALDLVIRPADISKFAINRANMERALHLQPALHAQMVKRVADVIKRAGLIGDAFRSSSTPDLFTNAAPTLTVVDGDSRTRAYSTAAPPLLTGFSLNTLPARLTRAPVRIAVLDALGEITRDFFEALRRTAERDHGVTLTIVRERAMRVISQANIESAIRLLVKEDADVILICLPDDPPLEDDSEDAGTTSRYAVAQCIGRGSACLLISESQINDADALPRLLIALLARVGVQAFVIDSPLDDTNYVIGLSLLYQDKRDGAVVSGISRLYTPAGRLLTHHLLTQRSQDGTIPESLLATLLPRDRLRGKRALLHLNGRMRRDALEALGAWEAEIDAHFAVVEVITSGSPRMYALAEKMIQSPAWGSSFRIGINEALVHSTRGSIHPLHLRAEAPLTIDDAINSVLRFTALHSSGQPEALPVTLQHMTIVESGILRGIAPESLTGDRPYWL